MQKYKWYIICVAFFAVSLLAVSHNSDWRATTNNVLGGCDKIGKYKSTSMPSIGKQEWFLHLAETMPLDKKYGSHAVPLLASSLLTKGPLFEMGCGFFSTPILSRLSREQGRYVLSADTDMEWLSKLSVFKSPCHDFVYVPVYQTDPEKPDESLWESVGNDTEWSVVFVDHKPSKRRVVDVQRFANRAEIVVIHDTEQPLYHYQRTIASFKYSYEYTKYNTHTTVVSNKRQDVILKIEEMIKWTEEYLLL